MPGLGLCKQVYLSPWRRYLNRSRTVNLELCSALVIIEQCYTTSVTRDICFMRSFLGTRAFSNVVQRLEVVVSIPVLKTAQVQNYTCTPVC